MSQTLVIVGAQGDLTSRLLLPGLGGLIAARPARDIALVGSGRGTWTDEHWRSVVAEAFVARTGADELMVTSQIYDHAARLRGVAIHGVQLGAHEVVGLLTQVLRLRGDQGLLA